MDFLCNELNKYFIMCSRTLVFNLFYIKIPLTSNKDEKKSECGQEDLKIQVK